MAHCGAHSCLARGGVAAAQHAANEAAVLALLSRQRSECAGRVGELPGECHVCRLTLISSPHLARSYHHLFPVEPFQELSQQQVQQLCTTPSGEGMGGGSQGEVPGQVSCFGCLQDLTPGSKLDRVGGLAMVLSCPTCCA
ncbi:VWFA domain-containing protein, partial [Haematococcus lacustris]